MAADSPAESARKDPDKSEQPDPKEHLFPLFDHVHDRGTTALVVVFAAGIGFLAGWVVADFGVRTPGFLVAALGTGYLLYDQPTRRNVLAAGLYSLAALLALVPVSYELGVLTTVDQPGRHIVASSDLVLLVAWWLVAAIPALAAYRVTTGPFLPRVRARGRDA